MYSINTRSARQMGCRAGLEVIAESFLESENTVKSTRLKLSTCLVMSDMLVSDSSTLLQEPFLPGQATTGYPQRIADFMSDAQEQPCLE